MTDKSIPSFGYAPSDFKALPFVFEMTRLGAQSHAPRRFAHRHAYLHILWVTEGHGVHAIDFAEYPLRPGSVFFIAPRQVHIWRSDAPVAGYSIKFSTDFFERIAGRCEALREFPFGFDCPAPAVELPASQVTSFQPLLETLLLESQCDARWRYDVIGAVVQQMLLMLRRTSPQDQSAETHDSPAAVARAFRRLLDLHFLSVRRPQDYAAMLEMSPTALADALKKTMGRTVHQMVADRLLLEARRRLMFSDTQISELAFELGFEDPAYFARFFRKGADMSPGMFRRTHQPSN